VGVMSYTAAENSTISLGVPLLRPALFTGTVGAVVGAKVTVTLAGAAAGTARPFAAGESYYLEVIGHVDGTTTALVGQRYELDEAATLADSSGQLTLDLASPHNTSPAAAPVKVTFAPTTAPTVPVTTAGRRRGTPRLIVEFSAAAYDMTPTGALPVWARTETETIATKPSAHRQQATAKFGNGRLVCMVCIRKLMIKNFLLRRNQPTRPPAGPTN
ncbi:MAG: hypothetical protein ACKVVO_00315, partial [Opitutaceae bacterium]